MVALVVLVRLFQLQVHLSLTVAAVAVVVENPLVALAVLAVLAVVVQVETMCQVEP